MLEDTCGSTSDGGYLPIGAYGAIGNLETVALVGRDGSIDWCPFPHVESPSTFAAILDDERGGRFAVRPSATFQGSQRYVEGTNVLETVFQTATGCATLTDFMPVPDVARGEDVQNATLYRKVTCEEGPLDVEVVFDPRFNYGRTVPSIQSTADGVVADGDDERAFLSSTVDLQAATDAASLTLSAGDTRWFVLGYGHSVPPDPGANERIRRAVESYWREWTHECEDGCPISGRWHGVAQRSELALKLLVHHSTGAICAAPTTSLPEDVGGVRNWDYRYNWIRDAVFTVRALAELGHLSEAKDYFDLCLSHCAEGTPAETSPVYGLHGDPVPEERTLDHLEGYRGSAPVRVGNAAGDQHQLDVYGELVQGVYATSLYGEPISPGEWDVLRDVVDYVCDAWSEPDAGIWEIRRDRRHHVYSKVMCWVAVDRGIRIAEETDLEGTTARWRDARDSIEDAVLERGYSDRVDSFVRSFESDDALDATSLLLPVVGFLPPDDPRVQSTIDATLDRLVPAAGLVDRYEGDDGLPGEEGSFVLCAYWLVMALALSGRVEEAETHLQAAIERASPVGLLSEEVDPESGAHLGNFPQAFSHIGLLNGVIYLDEAIAGDTQGSVGAGPGTRTDATPTACETDQ